MYAGILLPLCQSQQCTLREATIIGSVLAKVSIPSNHSAAALLRLAQMPYSGSNSVFLRILINKKYALPKRVVDALVDHFASFAEETRELPVSVRDSIECVSASLNMIMRAGGLASIAAGLCPALQVGSGRYAARTVKGLVARKATSSNHS